MVGTMSDGLTVFQYDLLSVLREHGPQKGTAVKRRLEDSRERYEGSINHGRLYPNLDTLVEMGLVEKGERDKRTNEYRVTAQGNIVLIERIAELSGDDND